MRGSKSQTTTPQSKAYSSPILETRPDAQSDKQTPVVQEVVYDNKKRAADEKERVILIIYRI